MPEFAFDGLVGPTHHYAGQSPGNIASTRHAGEPGNPRAAALQGLAKARTLSLMGSARAFLPPHERPHLGLLRGLGFTGKDADVLAAVHRDAPLLLSAASSASSMWAANAATVAPSSDTRDARVHLTPANLVSMLHRALETPFTERLLRHIFADSRHFAVHAPLPAHLAFGDEGAANHTRLATSRGALHLFGWGRDPAAARHPERFPARQAREASRAVARLHLLPENGALFWQQDPDGIDGGAFHSDVLAVGSGAVFLLHERAFLDSGKLVPALRARLGAELSIIEISEAELPLADAVAAYPLNSELVPLASGGFAIAAPRESQENPAARAVFERIQSESNPIESVTYVEVNDSMKNGGGPACLRLRVELTAAERAAISARVFHDAALDRALVAWVERHYRDRLELDELQDPHLLDESRRALDELTALLALGSIYDFQQTG